MSKTQPDTHTYYCEHCDRKLNPNKITWLELNNHTNTYHAEGDEVPEEESQGMFTFGATCAKKIIANGGTW
jgi:hypothetical protein